MTRNTTLLVLALAGVILLALPVGATLVLSGVSFTPDAPVIPGGQQRVTATYTVIPSGSTTFANGHSLQLLTNLATAQWTIQVTQDRRNAARQTASGSATFVNGEILSYSTSHDVGVVITVEGTVSPDAAGQVMVLQVEELDNSGNVVPGSILSITQPVAGPVSPAGTTVLPTLTAPPATTPLPKGSPGFAPLSGIIALIAMVVALRAGFR